MGEFVVIGKRNGKSVELHESETLEDINGEVRTYDNFDNFNLVYREGYTEHRLFDNLDVDELAKTIQDKVGNG